MTYSIWRNQNPKIAVIISTYNDEKYLQKCLNSLENCLKNKDWALFIGIDGSTDKTLEILNNHQTSAKIYIVDKFEKAETVSIAKNRAIKLAVPYLFDYEAVLFMDADDELLPGRINFLLPLTVKNNNLISVGDYIVESEDYPDFNGNIYHARPHEHYLNSFGPPMTVIHSSIIPSDGKLFNEQLKSLEDTELWLRLKIKQNINIIPYTGELVHKYYRRFGSVLNTNKEENKRIWKSLEKQYLLNNKFSFDLPHDLTLVIELTELHNLNDLGILYQNIKLFNQFPNIRFLILDSTENNKWKIILEDNFYKEIAFNIIKYKSIYNKNKEKIIFNETSNKSIHKLNHAEILEIDKLNSILIKNKEKFAVAVITAPRRNPTIKKTLDDITREGLKPIIIAEPNSYIPPEYNHLQIVKNETRLNNFPNFHKACKTLLAWYPNSEYYIIFQDDIYLTNGLKKYIEDTLFQNCGAASLFTTTNYLDEKTGWKELKLGHYRTFGALGFVFNKKILQEIINDPIIQQQYNEKGSTDDSLVGGFLLRNGYSMSYHTPSLIGHQKENISTLRNSELGPIVYPEICDNILDIPYYSKNTKDTKIGLIGWNTNQGLGEIDRDLVNNLNIDRWIIPKHPDFTESNFFNNTNTKLINTQINEKPEVIKEYLKGLHYLLFAEYPYINNLAGISREMGIPNVCIAMWEWLNPNLPWLNFIDIFICPTKFTFDLLKKWKKQYNYTWDLHYIPHPLDLSKFSYTNKSICNTFLYNNGTGGGNPTLETGESLGKRKGLKYITEIAKLNSDISFIINSQVDINNSLSNNVKLNINNQPTNKNLYNEGDIAIQCSMFEGIGLQLLESMACGIPIITVNSAPMNEYFGIYCDNYEVDCKNHEFSFKANIPYISSLDTLVKRFHKKDISLLSKKSREFIENNHNWEKSRELYNKILNLK